MSDLRMVCPCLLGVEGLVAEELRAMEARDVEPQNGRVLFCGDETILARANLNSRYSERVQILMGSFRAVTFESRIVAMSVCGPRSWKGPLSS